MELDTFIITVAGEPFTCRRPTHGELDLGKLQRSSAVVVMYQQKIAEVEAHPEAEDADERVASYVELAGKAATRVRDMVRRALERIAEPRAAALLDPQAHGEEASVQRGFLAAAELYQTLARPQPGKSSPSSGCRRPGEGNGSAGGT